MSLRCTVLLEVVTVASVCNGVPDSLVQCLLQGITPVDNIGMTFRNLAVTLRTIMFSIQQFYFVLTSRLRLLYGIQKKTATLIFQVTGFIFYNRGGDCYCAVRKESYKADYV